MSQEGYQFEKLIMQRESPEVLHAKLDDWMTVFLLCIDWKTRLGTPPVNAWLKWQGMFDFLFHHDSPENIYYRWRTELCFSFAIGFSLLKSKKILSLHCCIELY